MELLKQEEMIKQVPPIDEVSTDAFIGCINEFDGDKTRASARDWKG
jgi:hypothetical protein